MQIRCDIQGSCHWRFIDGSSGRRFAAAAENPGHIEDPQRSCPVDATTAAQPEPENVEERGAGQEECAGGEKVKTIEHMECGEAPAGLVRRRVPAEASNSNGHDSDEHVEDAGDYASVAV